MKDSHLFTVFLCVIALGLCTIVQQVISGGALGDRRRGEVDNGYWGQVESSVDWCEENYVEAWWVAEWYNTWTCLAISAAGIGAWFSMRAIGAEKRYLLQCALLTLVGLGSVAFHGSLLRHMQAADEVPMVWLVAVGFWSAIQSTQPDGSRLPEWVPSAMFSLLLADSYVNAFFHGQLAAALFHASFVPLMLGYCYLCASEMLRTNDPGCRAIHRMGLCSFAIAFVCWQIDIVGCATLQQLPFSLPNPQLHAWGWHVLSAQMQCDRPVHGDMP